MERFMAILRQGGSIMCHPDTLKAFRKACPASCADLWLASYINVMPSEHIKPGILYAVAKTPSFMDKSAWGYEKGYGISRNPPQSTESPLSEHFDAQKKSP